MNGLVLLLLFASDSQLLNSPLTINRENLILVPNIHQLTVKGKVSGITTTFKQRCKPVHFQWILQCI